jgi:hypothetical protein
LLTAQDIVIEKTAALATAQTNADNYFPNIATWENKVANKQAEVDALQVTADVCPVSG